MTNEERARELVKKAHIGGLFDDTYCVHLIERAFAQVQAEAILAEHKSHVEFESELYAILVDPLAEGTIKEAEMRKQLLEQARWYRQRVYELEGVSQRVCEKVADHRPVYDDCGDIISCVGCSWEVPDWGKKGDPKNDVTHWVEHIRALASLVVERVR